VSPARWRWLGRVPFAATAAVQERVRDALLDGVGPETFLLCEHDPVITLGRSAQPAHVLASPAALAARDVSVVRASRGGDVTFHGPGQLVGYPVVRLRGGIVAHVEAMARAVAELLAALGIASEWRRDRPGLWVGDAKICAVGVHVHRRVAVHGFALNVSNAPEDFNLIVPCGLSDGRVTSVARELGGRAPIPPLHVLAARVARAFGNAIGTTFVPALERCAFDLHADPFATKIELSNGITRMIGA